MARAPKKLVDDVALATAVPRWAAEGVVRGFEQVPTEADADARVFAFKSARVNSKSGLGSADMASVTEYDLTNQAQAIAHNTDASVRAYVLVNMTVETTAELLGDADTLGEGIPVAANEKSSFTLAPGESINAAAPAGDNVKLRVMEYQPG